MHINTFHSPGATTVCGGGGSEVEIKTFEKIVKVCRMRRRFITYEYRKSVFLFLIYDPFFFSAKPKNDSKKKKTEKN